MRPGSVCSLNPEQSAFCTPHLFLQVNQLYIHISLGVHYTCANLCICTSMMKLQSPEIYCASCTEWMCRQGPGSVMSRESSRAGLKNHEIALKPITRKHLPGKINSGLTFNWLCLIFPSATRTYIPCDSKTAFQLKSGTFTA